MSIISGKGYLITVIETDLVCPICQGHFDADEIIEKSDDFFIETKCPNCKSAIGIVLPAYGGTTKCIELDVPDGVVCLETKADFTVNG